jgi:hypothetical protein
VLARPVDGDLLAAAENPDGRRLRRPAVDLTQSIHGGRY